MDNFNVAMVFFTDKYKELSLNVPYCKGTLTDSQIKTAMQGIIDSGILKSDKGLAIQSKQATFTSTAETLYK